MREVWRGANRFMLLPEGRHFIPAILSAIDEAKEFLLVEQYLVESGELTDLFIEALVDASRRSVSVLFLLDSYGAKGLTVADRERLEQAGVAVRFFNPLALGRFSRNLTRDHRKLVVVDQKAAFTGGFCLVDDSMNAWYDVVVKAEGPVIADWTRLFCKLWNSPAARGEGESALLPAVKNNPPLERYVPGMRGRVVWSRGYRQQAIRKSLYHRIEQANGRLWLCTPYFAPSLGLRRRLTQAARRGVDVRLLLPDNKNHDHPGVHYAGQRFYTRLLEAGIRIYEFKPAFIHAKFCLVDDWSTFGSCNFDHWSLQWNLEANQEIEDRGFSVEVATLFERNFAASDEIDPDRWAQRPYWQRVMEWLYGKISALLMRLR